MTEPFKANTAKKLSQIAQANIEIENERKKLEAAEQRRIRREEVKNRKAFVKKIYSAWSKQRKLIISAAVKGLYEIQVNSSICRPLKLIDLGLDITELDPVAYDAILKSKTEKREQLEHQRWRKVEELSENIQRIFDRFIADFSVNSKSRVSKYYFEFSDFEREQRADFGSCLDSLNHFYDYSRYSLPSWSPHYVGGGVTWGEMDMSITSKYESKYFYAINEKIEACKDIFLTLDDKIHNINLDIESMGDIDFNIEEMVDMEHMIEANADKKNNFVLGICKHKYTDGSATLFPASEKNILKISFGFSSTESEQKFLTSPLFSWSGLHWLSNFSGQALLKSLYDQLKADTGKGKSSTNLRFKLSEDGWYFESPNAGQICSCVPNDLAEIFSNDGYSINETIPNNTSYIIEISW